ncbi:MAG TPA: hypothetical protein VGH74_15530 [Planctomycetaceae bacterium]|jgi:hypothetical protein
MNREKLNMSPEMRAVQRELTISRDELLSRAAGVAKWIEDCLADGTHETWMPHLTVWRKPGAGQAEEMSMFALAVDFNTDAEKRRTMHWAGQQVADAGGGPTCAILTAEAWASSDKRFSGGPDGSQPKDDPNNREIITVQGMTMMHPLCVGAQTPLRRARGRILPVKFDKPAILNCPRLKLIEWFVQGYMAGIAMKHGRDLDERN